MSASAKRQSSKKTTANSGSSANRVFRISMTAVYNSDAIDENDVVVLHDDLLATGGTMEAAYELVKSMNPKKIYINFLVELSDLNGRKAFPTEVVVTSLISY